MGKITFSSTSNFLYKFRQFLSCFVLSFSQSFNHTMSVTLTRENANLLNRLSLEDVRQHIQDPKNGFRQAELKVLTNFMQFQKNSKAKFPADEAETLEDLILIV